MRFNIINDEFINRLETLSLNMPNPMQGYFGGVHRTRTYGNTVEFADFRDYNLGDDIRRIDWNLYSRFEKHFIRLYVDERQMHIQIFVDCSASMYKGNKDKALYALRIMAALGYLSVQNMDKLTMRLMKGDFAEDPCGIIVGKNSFFRGIGQIDEAAVFDGDCNLESAIVNCENLGSNDGLTVIISDFLTDSNWKRAVDYLVFKKRQVLVVQVLSPEEIDPRYKGRVQMMDSESGDVMDPKNMKLKITKAHFKAYREALEDYIRDIKDFCTSRGALFISGSTATPIEKFIFQKLFEIGTIK
ncbi:MAG: DUF58 domain-containing protein [Firmicutes bacterium]|nr:DUF58 domain-containing protein [Bacillota bacterium]